MAQINQFFDDLTGEVDLDPPKLPPDVSDTDVVQDIDVQRESETLEDMVSSLESQMLSYHSVKKYAERLREQKAICLTDRIALESLGIKHLPSPQRYTQALTLTNFNVSLEAVEDGKKSLGAKIVSFLWELIKGIGRFIKTVWKGVWNLLFNRNKSKKARQASQATLLIEAKQTQEKMKTEETTPDGKPIDTTELDKLFYKSVKEGLVGYPNLNKYLKAGKVNDEYIAELRSNLKKNTFLELNIVIHNDFLKSSEEYKELFKAMHECVSKVTILMRKTREFNSLSPSSEVSKEMRENIFDGHSSVFNFFAYNDRKGNFNFDVTQVVLDMKNRIDQISTMGLAVDPEKIETYSRAEEFINLLNTYKQYDFDDYVKEFVEIKPSNNRDEFSQSYDETFKVLSREWKIINALVKANAVIGKELIKCDYYYSLYKSADNFIQELYQTMYK